MSAQAKVIPIASGEAFIEHGGAGMLIPEGEYQAKFTGHDTSYVFKTPKAFLHFEIVDPGEYCGAELFRAYRVAALIDKPRQGESSVRNGKFKLKARSSLFEMLCRVLDIQTRPDRISVRDLKNHVLKIKVRTVTTNYRGKPLPGFLQYSTVDEVMGIEA